MRNLVVDTSALLAFFDASEPDHEDVAAAVESGKGLLVVSPFVLAEVDYLVATRHGVDAELAVWKELTAGAWELPCLDREELMQARSIIARYHDQDIGIADASQVLLAHRYRADAIVTLDRRHFTVLRALDGGALTVLP